MGRTETLEIEKVENGWIVTKSVEDRAQRTVTTWVFTKIDDLINYLIKEYS